MPDVHNPEQRSRNMAAIRSKNTKPELLVRQILRSMGYRFRLHPKNLPGRPDIVLTKHKRVIFVHGCFWHMHQCRFGKVIPQTNAKFWQQKRVGNLERDQRNVRTLRKAGWQVTVVWACSLRFPEKIQERLYKLLNK